MSDDEVYVSALGRTVSVAAMKDFAAAMVRAMKPLTDYLATPEGNAALAAADAERAIPNCHCLCGVVHRNQRDVCLGEHSAVAERLLQTPRGDVWVSVCPPCEAAAGGETKP